MSEFLKEMEKTFYVPQKLLTLTGLQPGMNSKFGKIREIVSVFFLFFFNGSLLNGLCCDWPDVPKEAAHLNKLTGGAVALIKYIMFMIHRDKIADLIKIMRTSFWTEIEKDDNIEMNLVRSYGRLAYKVNICQAVGLMSMLPLIIISGHAPWIVGKIFDSANDHPMPRVLFITSWYSPYIDVHATPFFEIILLCQYLSVFFSLLFPIISDTLFVFLVLSISAQFRLVQERIKKFNTQRNQREAQHYIFKCLQYHQELGKMCDELNNCYTLVLFCHCGLDCLYLCVNAYMIVLYGSDKIYLMYKGAATVSMIFEVFLSCYCADYLAYESAAVADAAYDCNWPDAPKNIKQIVQIIIMRAQQPVYISMGGFAPVTLATFQMLMRCSYSFFAMLQTTTATD